MQQDLYNSLHFAESINLAARSGNVTGSGVDLEGYQGAVAVGICDAWSAGMGTHAIALYESDDNSTYTAVATANLVGSAPTLSGQVNRVFGKQ